jgi:hypothetical protein
MGNAFTKGIESGIGSVLGGVGTAVLGLATLNPVLMGLGAAGVIAGSVQGATTAAAVQTATNEGRELNAQELSRQKTIDEMAARAQRLHEGILSDAKRGAYGAAGAKTVDAFAKIAASGLTLKGAINSAGLTPGWGSAFDKNITNQMNKYVQQKFGNGVMSPALAAQFGNGVHRQAGVHLRGAGTRDSRTLYTTLRNSEVHAMFAHLTSGMRGGGGGQPAASSSMMATSSGGGPGGGGPGGGGVGVGGVGRQSQIFRGAISSSAGGPGVIGAIGNPYFASGTRSYQQRLSQGSIQARPDGTFSAVYSG